MKNIKSFAIFFLSYCFFSLAPCVADDINPMLFYYGGGAKLKNSDSKALANYDIIVLDRFRFRQIGGNGWKDIKKYNPETKIFLYQLGPESAINHDSYEQAALNNISRFKKDRTGTDGAIKYNHAEWILKNMYGLDIYNPGYKDFIKLDFGNEEFQKFWFDATKEDVLTKKWKADGIFIDNLAPWSFSYAKELVGRVPAKYDSIEKWNKATNSFITYQVNMLRENKQLVMPNRGATRYEEGFNSWLDLDKETAAPEYVLDEGAFAVSYGLGDVQFVDTDGWLRQVVLPEEIKKSHIAYIAHTDLNTGESGRDMLGRKVSFGDVFYYSLASYLVAKNETNTTFFMFDFNRKKGALKTMSWFDVYNSLGLGIASGQVKKSDSSPGVYTRDFQKGVVYVNPTSSAVDIAVKKGQRYLAIDNYGKSSRMAFPSAKYRLESNRALIVYK